MSDDRERAIVESFVAMSSTLARGYDVVELLEALTSDCARLLDIGAAGLLLADEQGDLHLMAASSEPLMQLELFQLHVERGPCLDCFRTAMPVSVPDLTAEGARWPQFTIAAQAAGFASLHAVPMQLQQTTLGALGLFGTSTGSLGADDLRLAQALAAVASVAIIQGKAAADRDQVVTQLQHALDSRIVIEQAKGIIAQHAGLNMTGAYAVLRRYARDHNLQMSALADSVASGALPVERLTDHVRGRTL